MKKSTIKVEGLGLVILTVFLLIYGLYSFIRDVMGLLI